MPFPPLQDGRLISWRVCVSAQVEEVLGEEPDVKEQLFEVLKQYAAERDVEALAEALPDILTSEEHQQLIDSVRYTSTTTTRRQGALQSPPCLGWKSFVIYIYIYEGIPETLFSTSGLGICRCQ